MVRLLVYFCGTLSMFCFQISQYDVLAGTDSARYGQADRSGPDNDYDLYHGVFLFYTAAFTQIAGIHTSLLLLQISFSF
jgi:hypothetical protein